MTRRAGVLVTLVAFSGLFAACSSSGQPSTEGATHPPKFLKVGQPAPDFTLPTASGSTVSLAQFRGQKPVLLYFSMGPG